jgi:hypothetical protein
MRRLMLDTVRPVLCIDKSLYIPMTADAVS